MKNDEYEDVSGDETLEDVKVGFSGGTWEPVGPKTAVMRLSLKGDTYVAYATSVNRLNHVVVFLNGNRIVLNHRSFRPLDMIKQSIIDIANKSL